MITEDYVSFEVAKLLKEKGFDELTCGYYHDDYIETLLVSSPSNHNGSINAISAPSLGHAMKWLRKNHKIHVDIDYIDFLEHGEVWSAKIVDMVTFKETKIESTCNYYEQMTNEAIEFYLKNLNK